MTCKGLPTIAWNGFLPLLHQNRTNAFEFHVAVGMGDDTPDHSGSENHAHAFALGIAKEIWDQTEFCFK
jgi:hypothetical protein